MRILTYIQQHKYQIIPTGLLNWKLTEDCQSLNFISTNTKVWSNLIPLLCIRECNIEPCCDKRYESHMRTKSWPLIGQKEQQWQKKCLCILTCVTITYQTNWDSPLPRTVQTAPDWVTYASNLTFTMTYWWTYKKGKKRKGILSSYSN